MKEKQITTLLWDVDGTLLDFTYSQRYAITRCFQLWDLAITDEIIGRYACINDTYWKRLELGEITKAELLVGRFITLFEEFGIKGVDVEAFREEYQDGLGSVYAYIDDALTICKALQGEVRQYIVTNGVASTQRKKLQLSGLAEVMDGIFISEELGAAKPQKEFFDKCFESIGEKDKNNIMIIGDSVSSDIKGGVNAGIRTCWYHPGDEKAEKNTTSTTGSESADADKGNKVERNALSTTDFESADADMGDKKETVWQADYEIQELHQIYDILNIFES